MATAIMCRLPHWPNGLPQGWGLGRLIAFDRLSYVREGFLTGPQRDLLDNLSTEAVRAGVCPNHLRILRGLITEAIADRSGPPPG